MISTPICADFVKKFKSRRIMKEFSVDRDI